MKHSCKFALEVRYKDGQKIETNVPLFAAITFAGTRIFYFTGYRMDWNKFDHSKKEVQKNAIIKEGAKDVQYNIANKRLTAMRAELNTLFEGAPTKQQVIDALDRICGKVVADQPQAPVYPFISLFRQYSTKTEVGEGRRRTIKSTINHWERFEATTARQLMIGDLTPELLRAFEEWLKSDIKQKGRNTRHVCMVITRSFWRFYMKSFTAAGFVYPFGDDGYSVPGESYGTPIYISSVERDQLAAMELNNERLKKVRDMFLLQCFFGCRVGDLCSLTHANLIGGFVQYVPRKTKDGKPITVTIPLHPTAKAIIESYDVPDGRLLPYISDQRYNEYLKELFELAGLTRKVIRINSLTGESEPVRICDIASSHMARRTFVGNLYGRVDSGVISSMSGHVPNSRAFARYYTVSDDLKNKAIEIL